MEPFYYYLILTWVVLMIWAVGLILWYHKYQQRQLELREFNGLVSIAIGFIGGLILKDYLIKKGILENKEKIFKGEKIKSKKRK